MNGGGDSSQGQGQELRQITAAAIRASDQRQRRHRRRRRRQGQGINDPEEIMPLSRFLPLSLSLKSRHRASAVRRGPRHDLAIGEPDKLTHSRAECSVLDARGP